MALRAALAVLALLTGVVPAGAQERAAVARPATPVPPDLYPIASDARLGGDAGRTRLVFDLSRTIENRGVYARRPLPGGDRPAAGHLSVARACRRERARADQGLPLRSRDAGRLAHRHRRERAGSRIVIDASGPVRIDKAFVLESVDNQPARLVLDLVATDRASFMRTLALEAKPRRAPETRPAEVAKRANDGRPLIVIDPGHGGPDTGTIAASGEMEKAIVLEFAQTLSEKLHKSGKYRVTMTRDDDRFVPLGERVRIARGQGAALLISIHADALASRHEADVRGATVYTVSDSASDDEAARLAEQENKADAIAGVDLSAEPEEVADILIDLTSARPRIFPRISRALSSAS